MCKVPHKLWNRTFPTSFHYMSSSGDFLGYSPCGITTRTEILNSIIVKRGYKSYLEIGVGDGSNFRNIRCPDKTGVDPEEVAEYQVTSDRFFALNRKTFDIILIDGLHHKENVRRDIENALRFLNPGGAVVCHDLNPATEIIQRVPRVSEEWTGDCWKAWVQLRTE